MASSTPYHKKTIAEYHKLMELSKPEHPLVSVVKFEDIKRKSDNCPGRLLIIFILLH